MPKTLVVPLDGSPDAEVAVPVAEEFAERLGAEIVVVAAQLDGVIPTGRPDIAKESLHAYPEHTEIVRSVSVADAVRAVADDTNDPVVCMATHARSAVGHVLFGSVAEDVVRALAIPAVLVGPECSPPVRLEGPVLVCVDGSVASNAIVPIAREWALALGTRVVLVTVFHPLDVETATRPEAVLAGALEALGTEVDVETRLVRGYSPAGDDRRVGRRAGTCARRDRNPRADRAGAPGARQRRDHGGPPQHVPGPGRAPALDRFQRLRFLSLTRSTPRCVHYNSSASGRPPNSVTSPSRNRDQERSSSASAAAGACHSDLHLMDDFSEGMLPWSPPFTLGHENAGWIQASVRESPGSRSTHRCAIYGPWGCGLCKRCRQGMENYCERQELLGAAGGGLGRDGGMAPLMKVGARHVVPLKSLAPVDAAPLTDAGLTPYHAIKRSLPLLSPGSFAVVIGAGGLGHMAVQILQRVHGDDGDRNRPKPRGAGAGPGRGCDACRDLHG